MQSLIFVKPGTVEWREVDAPRLQGDGDALVRPVASTTCDLDQLILAGRTPFRGPFAFGHECVAQVVEVGRDVTAVKPGDLVAVPWHVACGVCPRCSAGLPAHCTTVPSGAMYGLPANGAWGGLFDELVRVPHAEHMLVALPGDVDPASVAGLGDNLSIAHELLGPHLRAKPASRVLVLGAGSVAQFAADTAVALGASRVLYVDNDADRRRVAASVGAEVTAGPITSDLGEFDIVFDAAFDADMLRASLAVLVPEGVVESAGIFFDPVPLPLFEMYRRGVSFHTARANARTHLPAVLQLVRDGRLHPDRVVTGIYEMDDAPHVLPTSGAKPVFVRQPVN